MRTIKEITKSLYRYTAKPIENKQSLYKDENNPAKDKVYKKNIILIDASDENKTSFLPHTLYKSYTTKNTVTLSFEKGEFFQAHQTKGDKNNLMTLIQGRNDKLDISDMTARDISQYIKKAKEKNKLSKLKNSSKQLNKQTKTKHANSKKIKKPSDLDSLNDDFDELNIKNDHSELNNKTDAKMTPDGTKQNNIAQTLPNYTIAKSLNCTIHKISGINNNCGFYSILHAKTEHKNPNRPQSFSDKEVNDFRKAIVEKVERDPTITYELEHNPGKPEIVRFETWKEEMSKSGTRIDQQAIIGATKVVEKNIVVINQDQDRMSVTYYGHEGYEGYENGLNFTKDNTIFLYLHDNHYELITYTKSPRMDALLHLSSLESFDLFEFTDKEFKEFKATPIKEKLEKVKKSHEDSKYAVKTTLEHLALISDKESLKESLNAIEGTRKDLPEDVRSQLHKIEKALLLAEQYNLSLFEQDENTPQNTPLLDLVRQQSAKKLFDFQKSLEKSNHDLEEKIEKIAQELQWFENTPLNQFVEPHGYPQPLNQFAELHGYPQPLNQFVEPHGYPQPLNQFVELHGRLALQVALNKIASLEDESFGPNADQELAHFSELYKNTSFPRNYIDNPTTRDETKGEEKTMQERSPSQSDEDMENTPKINLENNLPPATQEQVPSNQSDNLEEQPEDLSSAQPVDLSDVENDNRLADETNGEKKETKEGSPSQSDQDMENTSEANPKEQSSDLPAAQPADPSDVENDNRLKDKFEEMKINETEEEKAKRELRENRIANLKPQMNKNTLADKEFEAKRLEKQKEQEQKNKQEKEEKAKEEKAKQVEAKAKLDKAIANQQRREGELKAKLNEKAKSLLDELDTHIKKEIESLESIHDEDKKQFWNYYLQQKQGWQASYEGMMKSAHQAINIRKEKNYNEALVLKLSSQIFTIKYYFQKAEHQNKDARKDARIEAITPHDIHIKSEQNFADLVSKISQNLEAKSLLDKLDTHIQKEIESLESLHNEDKKEFWNDYLQQKQGWQVDYESMMQKAYWAINTLGAQEHIETLEMELPDQILTIKYYFMKAEHQNKDAKIESITSRKIDINIEPDFTDLISKISQNLEKIAAKILKESGKKMQLRDILGPYAMLLKQFINQKSTDLEHRIKSIKNKDKCSLKKAKAKLEEEGSIEFSPEERDNFIKGMKIFLSNNNEGRAFEYNAKYNAEYNIEMQIQDDELPQSTHRPQNGLSVREKLQLVKIVEEQLSRVTWQMETDIQEPINLDPIKIGKIVECTLEETKNSIEAKMAEDGISFPKALNEASDYIADTLQMKILQWQSSGEDIWQNAIVEPNKDPHMQDEYMEDQEMQEALMESCKNTQNHSNFTGDGNYP